jgi:flagellar basal-body rod modification protein FlgD
MDQKDMLGQMAQFSQLEQLTNLASTMSNMTLTNSVALMGKTIDYSTEDAQGNDLVVRGVTVDGISTKDGKVFLELSDGARIEPNKIASVY